MHGYKWPINCTRTRRQSDREWMIRADKRGIGPTERAGGECVPLELALQMLGLHTLGRVSERPVLLGRMVAPRDPCGGGHGG